MIFNPGQPQYWILLLFCGLVAWGIGMLCRNFKWLKEDEELKEYYKNTSFFNEGDLHD